MLMGCHSPSPPADPLYFITDLPARISSTLPTVPILPNFLLLIYTDSKMNPLFYSDGEFANQGLEASDLRKQSSFGLDGLDFQYDNAAGAQNYPPTYGNEMSGCHIYSAATSVPSLLSSAPSSRQNSQDSYLCHTTATFLFTEPAVGQGQFCEEPQSYLPENASSQMVQQHMYPVNREGYSQEAFTSGRFNSTASSANDRNFDAAVGGGQCKEHGVLSKSPKEKRAFCICGRMFEGDFASSNLTRHLRELKVQPVSCAYCSTSFARPHNLHQHCKKFHPHELCCHCESKRKNTRMPYQCGTCGMSFARQDDLNRHIQNAHPAY